MVALANQVVEGTDIGDVDSLRHREAESGLHVAENNHELEVGSGTAAAEEEVTVPQDPH